LLTLQGPGPLVAPFAAALARLPSSNLVRQGSRAWRRADTLALDAVVLEWGGAAIANTGMPESAARPGLPLSRLVAGPRGDVGRGASPSLGRRARCRLGAGLRQRDPQAFIDGACQLLGLGEGLTPSGDDCLVGSLAVIHRFCRSWLREHPEIAASVADAAAA